RILRRAIDAVRGRSKIGSLCLKDVRHEGLRIAIDEREPRALHLHHHTMSFEKRVVLRVEAPGVFRDRVRHDRLRFLEAFSEPADAGKARGAKDPTRSRRTPRFLPLTASRTTACAPAKSTAGVPRCATLAATRPTSSRYSSRLRTFRPPVDRGDPCLSESTQ